MFPRRRLLDALLVLAVAAVTSLVLQPRETAPITHSSFSVRGIPELGIVAPQQILIQPDSIASIHGATLGASRSELKPLLESTLGAEEAIFGDVRYIRGEHCVNVSFNENGIATYLSGCCLEVDGVTCINRLTPINEPMVDALLGTPDSKGCAGAGMCEGSFGGYRYESIGTTIIFSWTYDNIVSLSEENSWVDWGDGEYHF